MSRSTWVAELRRIDPTCVATTIEAFARIAEGATAMPALKAAMRLPPSTWDRTARRLVSMGLVVIYPLSRDERSRAIELTPLGLSIWHGRPLVTRRTSRGAEVRV